jgi:heme-degrading monooxygenase HmoA
MPRTIAPIDAEAPCPYRLRDLHVVGRVGGSRMWAQLITMRLREGGEAGLSKVLEQLRAIEQPDSGWVRTTALRDQNDPRRVLLLVVFQSEEKARARESDPRRQAGLQSIRAVMAEVFDGAPDFVDLTVVEEVTP